jgi:hypothetical protein
VEQLVQLTPAGNGRCTTIDEAALFVSRFGGFRATEQRYGPWTRKRINACTAGLSFGKMGNLRKVAGMHFEGLK